MQIYLIRHGETEANLDPSKPATLTQKGKEQVKRLADKLESVKFDAIYCSNLERALVTAQALGEPIVTEELQEIFRVIIGGPPKQSRSNRKEEDTQRAEAFFNKMQTWNYEKVAVVAHGNILRYFLARFQDLKLTSMWEKEIMPASITIVENGNVKYITNHLEGLETLGERFVE